MFKEALIKSVRGELVEPCCNFYIKNQLVENTLRQAQGERLNKSAFP